MSAADIVLFGEHHDNPIVHWLQFETTKELADRQPVVLGAEMFEADDQPHLTAYLKGSIDQSAFDTLARLWPNYKTDYKPLVDLAKQQALPLIATNIPRRYARKVYRKGFEVLQSLSDTEKSWMAPLPIPYDASLPGYQQMIHMMGGHGGENLPKAQAVKDATMAYFILKNRQKNTLFLHYNGSRHSDNREGIYWYLKQANPTLKILTVSVVSQRKISRLTEESHQQADVIIAIPETMTKTY